MQKFMLNITASSGEFYQGDCESLTLPTGDGVYGVQAGHSPVLVALHMGILQFTVNGETRDVLVGDGIAEVTPTFVLLLVDSAERPEDIDRNRAEPPASAPKSACSTSRACTNITRARSLLTVPCSACRLPQSTSGKSGRSAFPLPRYNKQRTPPARFRSLCLRTDRGRLFHAPSDSLPNTLWVNQANISAKEFFVYGDWNSAHSGICGPAVGTGEGVTVNIVGDGFTATRMTAPRAMPRT
mgnify:CR=1 FL=1